jgi:hypothetical protein
MAGAGGPLDRDMHKSSWRRGARVGVAEEEGEDKDTNRSLIADEESELL